MKSLVCLPTFFSLAALAAACTQNSGTNGGATPEEFFAVKELNAQTVSMPLPALTAAGGLRPDQIKLVKTINGEMPEDTQDFFRNLLHVKLSNLTQDQFDRLMQRYSGWAANKSRVKFTAGKTYELSDFLPPAIQALEGKRFQPSRPFPVYFPNQGIPGGAFFPRSFTVKTNCWTTAFTVLRSSLANENRVEAFFMNNGIMKVMEDNAYSNLVAEHAIDALPDFATRNQGLQPGDLLLVRAIDRKFTNGHDIPIILHAGVYLGDDLFFEKIAWQPQAMYRFSTWSDIQSAYAGKDGRFILRRLTKPFPAATESLSVAGSLGKPGVQYPQILKEIITEEGYGNADVGHAAEGITSIGFSIDANTGRGVIDPKAFTPDFYAKQTGPEPAPLFSDTRDDPYGWEIQEAGARELVAVPADKKFNPANEITREQMAAMAVAMLRKVDGLAVNVPQRAAAAPFPDVPVERWSAAVLAFAKENKIVGGRPDGTFNPEGKVTRAEAVVILANAAKFARRTLGLSEAIPFRTTFEPMPDVEEGTHWAKGAIIQMQGYCLAASNKIPSRGYAFRADDSAQRNWVASATLRTYHCLSRDVREKK